MLIAWNQMLISDILKQPKLHLNVSGSHLNLSLKNKPCGFSCVKYFS